MLTPPPPWRPPPHTHTQTHPDVAPLVDLDGGSEVPWIFWAKSPVHLFGSHGLLKTFGFAPLAGLPRFALMANGRSSTEQGIVDCCPDNTSAHLYGSFWAKQSGPMESLSQKEEEPPVMPSAAPVYFPPVVSKRNPSDVVCKVQVQNNTFGVARA